MEDEVVHALLCRVCETDLSTYAIQMAPVTVDAHDPSRCGPLCPTCSYRAILH